MKRIGILTGGGCFGYARIRFGENDSIALNSRYVPKGFKDGDEVEVSLIDVNGSATWNIEHVEKKLTPLERRAKYLKEIEVINDADLMVGLFRAIEKGRRVR